MNYKRIVLFTSAALVSLSLNNVRADLPPDFPGFVVSNYNSAAVAPGCVFLAVASDLRPAVGGYMMIVANDGSVLWYEKMDVPAISDFKVAPNGRLVSAPTITAHSWTEGADATHQMRDANHNILETIGGGNGYVADSHDFQLLPNGNVLQLGYYFNEVDLSQVVPGGNPAAKVSGGIIQELDAQRNVVFQWRSWDHFGYSTNITSTNAIVDAFHLNTIDQDSDGHYLVTTPDWVRKINRQTGAVMWTLGGPDNEFTFSGGGAASDVGGYGFNRLANGHVLIYDNGGTNGASRAHEYQLDEVGKVATRVWTYTSSPAIPSLRGGNAQRLANGNTLIGWGGPSGAAIPACTEVTSAGEKVFEIFFTNSMVESYRAFRFDWPPTNHLQQAVHELANGNTYSFSIPAVTVEMISGGAGYNELTVTREPYAPVDPVFVSTAPRLAPVRVSMLESSIPSPEMNVSFDAVSFGFAQPENLTVYYRSQTGQGIFLAQPTAYNPGTHQLQTTLATTSSGGDLGEFVFGYPDVADEPYAPLLAAVENYRGAQMQEVIAPKLAAAGTVYVVNQGLPVLLSWSPQGLARWYALQLGTNADFTSLDLDLSYVPIANYVLSNAAPNTTYYYRVKTLNDGGESGWSIGAFQTAVIAPVTVTTSPLGLTIVADGTNYISPASFNWAAGSVHTLVAQSPQTAIDGHSRHVFSSWSHGGAQTNSIIVPSVATNYTASFSTQYLLATAVVPPNGGSISNYPAGPWYSSGQLVSLTARTNSGYRLWYWTGVDVGTSNVAQLTMDSYRLAQAYFITSSFPNIIITNAGGAAPGQLIGNIGGRTAEGTRTTYVILANDGTNVIYSSTNNTLLRFVTPQGFDAVASGGNFQFKDETLTPVKSVTTPGFTLDQHDIKLLPNGHALLFGQEFRTVDMSQVVSGGKTAATITGGVIQEVDASNRVVFQWHTFDYIAITNTFADMTQANFDYAHINAVTLDPTDNNLLVSLRTTSEIVKISRRTGQVMWRLGGKRNQFTFIGEHPENAPYYTVGQHDVHRLANGNLLYFDNGNISGGGLTPNDRTYSRAVEYAIDETNMTATLVWEYRHSPDILANCTGSLKRMANGNTFIDWGCAVSTSGFIVTEVNPGGQVVFEMKHRTNAGISSVLLGGGLSKQLWNDAALFRSTTFPDVQAGQTYTSAVAGVSVTISNISGPAGKQLTVQRHLDAVRMPQFAGKAPQVLMEQVVLAGSNITTFEAGLELSLPDNSYVFDTPLIHNPALLIVYQRPTPGQGQFLALPTVYDSGRQKLRVSTTQPGEFIFGYPDVDDAAPLTPVITGPADQSEVNQAAPVTMSWVPSGLFSSCDVQVATDLDFTNVVLNATNLGNTSFTMTNPAPTTQYYWRVRVVNEAGTSDWASASFRTVAPFIQVVYPAGGEAWQRFQVVTFRWNDNLSENVALDIYKGGVSNRTLVASTPSSGSYTWTVGQFQAFTAGSDYTLKIRSATNANLYAFSAPFAILVPPTLAGSAVTILPDGRLQFPISVPGALQATVLGSTNLMNWQVLQTVVLTNGAAVFTDEPTTNYTRRFYRVRVP